MKKIFTLLLFLVTSPVYAATYYVDCNNGSDASSGLSHAQAWKTVSKVKSSVKVTGDDVYFKAACTWKETLRIGWGGTASNRAIVGSYYMSGGTEIVGVSNGSEYPTFEGTCVSKTNCPNKTANAMPTTWGGAMISINGNYTTVKNLKVKNSSGVGIQVYGTLGENNQFNNNYILDNKVEHVLYNAIFLARTSHSNVVRGNDVTKAALLTPYDISKLWPAAIGIAGARNNIIEGNYVYNTFGEGIGVFGKSHKNIIRNNTIIKGNKAGVYVSCSSDNIIENNKVLGDRTGDFVRIVDGYPATSAYAAASETYCRASTERNIFRNNLAANTRGCLISDIQAGAATAGYESHSEFYNNTCVNVYSAIDVKSESLSGKASVIAKNNIITNSVLPCTLHNDSVSTYANNHFDTDPSAFGCGGANDVYGNPKLKVSFGWSTVGVNNIPPDSSFNVQAGSTAINNGISLPTISALNTANYPQSRLLNSCGFDQSKNSYDRNCIKRTSPDTMGAFSNNSSANEIIAIPTGLSMSIKLN